MKSILDTSAHVGFKRNVDNLVKMIVSAESILFSPIVLGELMFGFRNGTKFEENMNDFNQFLDHERVEIVPIG
jgi:tRNA(fMet)-specific endonuclease VapC